MHDDIGDEAARLSKLPPILARSHHQHNFALYCADARSRNGNDEGASDRPGPGVRKFIVVHHSRNDDYSASCFKWRRIPSRTKSQFLIPPRRPRWRALPSRRALTLVYPRAYRCGARIWLTKLSSVCPSTCTSSRDTWPHSLLGRPPSSFFSHSWPRVYSVQPRLQLYFVETIKLGAPINAIRDQHVLRLEVV